MKEQNTRVIIVAEGEESLRTRLVTPLRSAGFEVRATACGAECLRMVESDDVDLVMLDVELADMNGMEVLQQIHERHPGLPVLMVTGCFSSTASTLSSQTGASGYLCCPMERGLIVARVSDCLMRRSRHSAPPRGTGSSVDHRPGSRWSRWTTQERYGHKF